MLKTIIKKGSYQDSVALMLLTSRLSAMEGISKVSVMMATAANKSIFAQSGLETEKLLEAGANDMAIVADVKCGDVIDELLREVELFINSQAISGGESKSSESVRSWETAIQTLPEANLAVISIPGIYAAIEADRALDEGLNVFMFSDNVSIEDEVRLKQKAHDRGLLLMGPDCGTGIIEGVPIAFTNNTARGGIGIVGASGTGIQELTTIIDRLGEGVTNAIGTGGRDLYTEVGGITMLDAIDGMENNKDTKVLIIISKPPAKEVRDKILARLSNCKTPVVTLFLGEKPEFHENNFYHAYTLDEAARTAVQLLRGEAVTEYKTEFSGGDYFKPEENKSIKAYYSGGTLAGEAAMLIKDALGIKLPPEKPEGFMLNHNGQVVIDLGDDAYTQGKPHPMIDPSKRLECMAQAVDDPQTGVILFDVVLGYGSHEDMASALIPTIRQLRVRAAKANRKVFFVATVCGTRKDIQNYDKQVDTLKKAGVLVCETNALAAETAINIIGHKVDRPQKPILEKKVKAYPKAEINVKMQRLLSEKPEVINVGLKSFSKVLSDFECRVVQYDWTPPAGGNIEMLKTLRFLREYKFTGQEEEKA
ncbi:MAG: acyl-CoA synthetase FdrA [Oscillospiraceae bacterium]